jgi:hypothetical protein
MIANNLIVAENTNVHNCPHKQEITCSELSCENCRIAYAIRRLNGLEGMWRDMQNPEFWDKRND